MARRYKYNITFFRRSEVSGTTYIDIVGIRHADTWEDVKKQVKKMYDDGAEFTYITVNDVPYGKYESMGVQ